MILPGKGKRARYELTLGDLHRSLESGTAISVSPQCSPTSRDMLRLKIAESCHPCFLGEFTGLQVDLEVRAFPEPLVLVLPLWRCFEQVVVNGALSKRGSMENHTVSTFGNCGKRNLGSLGCTQRRVIVSMLSRQGWNDWVWSVGSRIVVADEDHSKDSGRV